MPQTTHQDLIVADICNTLYDSNTTFDFVRYCLDTGRLKKSLLHKISGARNAPLFWPLLVLQKLTGKDYHKQIAVSLFKGKKVEEVEEWTKSFYDNFLSKKIIPQTNELLKSFGKEQIVLASSTIEPVARIIASRLGLQNYVATALEVSSGRYTGKILSELSGRKLEALKEKFMKDGRKLAVVISDNFSDKDLMLSSEKKYAVCYNEKQATFWKKIEDINIVKIGH
jgi:Phosphoserine phosphatase